MLTADGVRSTELAISFYNTLGQGLLQILNFDWLLNHGLFVIVYGWQNENNKMAENFCFPNVCTEFRKAKGQKDYKIGSEDLQRSGEKFKPHINNKFTPICVKI